MGSMWHLPSQIYWIKDAIEALEHKHNKQSPTFSATDPDQYFSWMNFAEHATLEKQDEHILRIISDGPRDEWTENERLTSDEVRSAYKAVIDRVVSNATSHFSKYAPGASAGHRAYTIQDALLHEYESLQKDVTHLPDGVWSTLTGSAGPRATATALQQFALPLESGKKLSLVYQHHIVLMGDAAYATDRQTLIVGFLSHIVTLLVYATRGQERLDDRLQLFFEFERRANYLPTEYVYPLPLNILPPKAAVDEEGGGGGSSSS